MNKINKIFLLSTSALVLFAAEGRAAPYAYQRLSDDYSAFKQKLQDEYGIITNFNFFCDTNC